MSRRFALAMAVLTAIAAGSLGWHFRTRGEAPSSLGSAPYVIVELFSSEGCASCPPADEYVATLDRTQPIEGVTLIVLELHVDYWDRLGWRDPFGAAAFSERQSEYARVFENHSIFTPEIVFGGNKLMIGGDEDRARTQILEAASEPKARVSIERVGRGKVSVTVADTPEEPPGDPLDVWLAVTESHLDSEVGAGENGGRLLKHAPVVRQLRKLGVVYHRAFHDDVEVDTSLSWKPAALRFVAFVQAARSRKIVGAAARNAHD